MVNESEPKVETTPQPTTSDCRNVITDDTTSGHNVITGHHADRVERLRARLDTSEQDFPEAWRPEPGGELVGHFEGWRQGDTRRGETHPVAIVRTLDGERRGCWAFFTVLRAELEKAAPEPGELIAIRRLADRTNGEGTPYRCYRVVVDREADADPLSNVAPPMDEGATSVDADAAEADAPDPQQTDWTLAGGRAKPDDTAAEPF